MVSRSGWRVVALAALLLPGLPSCSLVRDLLCPATEAVDPPVFVTPEETYRSFKRALDANNEYFEYLCLSPRALEKYEIDYQKYVLGRRHFLRTHSDEVEAFLDSELVEVRYGWTREFADDDFPDGHRIADVILTSGDRVGSFRLIDEPYYEIALKGTPDDPYPRSPWDFVPEITPFIEKVESGLVVRIPEGRDAPAPERIAGIELKNEWKVLQFLGVDEGTFDREKEGEEPPPRP